MAYETFEKTAARVADPTVSVATDGRIAFNAAASRLLEKAGVRAVTILWDRSTCGIAFQAAKKGDKNAFSLALRPGRSGTITVKRFLEYIGWSADQRQTVPAKWNEQQRMLEAQLSSNFVGKGAKKGTKRKEEAGL